MFFVDCLLTWAIWFFREWNRFAKGEYERLAMEEEGGDDSEMIDAMDGWDSEDDSQAQASDANSTAAASSTAASGTKGADGKTVDAG